MLAGSWNEKVLNPGDQWADASQEVYGPGTGVPLRLWVSLPPHRVERTGGIKNAEPRFRSKQPETIPL